MTEVLRQPSCVFSGDLGGAVCRQIDIGCPIVNKVSESHLVEPKIATEMLDTKIEAGEERMNKIWAGAS